MSATLPHDIVDKKTLAAYLEVSTSRIDWAAKKKWLPRHGLMQGRYMIWRKTDILLWIGSDGHEKTVSIRNYSPLNKLNKLSFSAKKTSIDTKLHALSDKTRRSIYRVIVRGPVRVTDIAALWPRFSLNNVSKHIKILEQAGLVKRTIKGRENIIEITNGALFELVELFSGMDLPQTED